MLKIKQIKIKNFRSIVNLNMDVERMNIFVGLNDVGKSNVLKALNLFFNGETEPKVEFDFETDYSKFAPIRKNKAKEVTISVTFAIPKHYKDNGDVVWTKVWRAEGQHYDSSADWDFAPYSKVPTLLKRVHYKYVPAVKSDNYFKLLLADLYVSIAREANGGLAEKAEEYSEALGAFTQGIGLRVQKSIGIKSDLIMPANQIDIFKELVFMTGDKSGKSITLSYRGDGIKAMHIPAILKYISEQDNRILANSAVPITTIWGYEEPENGIEMKKCFDLARELYDFSEEIQEFITTHSPGFYQLGNEKDVKVYYVHKKEDFTSQFCENMDIYDLHDKVGIMPLITPIISEKQEELRKAREMLADIKFVDKETIFVEGITDKDYLQMAISVFSPLLDKKIKEGILRIVTREENGCGTNLLVDWSVAWMHLNYTNKAIVLLDADETGAEAKAAINVAKEKYKKKTYKLKPLLLVPTEEMKIINHKIKKSIIITVEHLLSCDAWNVMKQRGWAQYRSSTELFNMFGNVLDTRKSLDYVIDELVDDEDLKETIVYWKPRDDKKRQILKFVQSEVGKGNISMIEGFRNTIIELEKEFG